MYPNVQLFIDGVWKDGAERETLEVLNPASGEAIGSVAVARLADLDEALAAAARGFALWRRVSVYDRYRILRRAGDFLRERVEPIARLITLEQGKPFTEAKGETAFAADIIDWIAEEGRRVYGRIVPSRNLDVDQRVLKTPVGPVAAFTPWNFPINQAVRKLAAALITGNSVILKGPEETPASVAELVRCFADAGVPAGVVGLVYGVPAEISGHLIPHPVIRKISFTGSTPVGKELAALAGRHMKRATMELGGHAPVIVCADADVTRAARALAGAKTRNAGQVCISPTRFLVHESIHDAFLATFSEALTAIRVGNGLEPGIQMGPLANPRRLAAMADLVADAVGRGARVTAGGTRIGNAGYFFRPTALADVAPDSRILNEEPFGPIAPVARFGTLDEAIAEANRLPWGLAAYAYTDSAKTIQRLSEEVEAGMISINHQGLALPETPFGGIKDSGQGSEGGSEILEAYVETRFVTTLLH